METAVTVLIVAAAGFWFARWLRAAASGKCGCSSSCGKCGKSKDCAGGR